MISAFLVLANISLVVLSFSFILIAQQLINRNFLISDENNVILEKGSYGANSVAQLLLL